MPSTEIQRSERLAHHAELSLADWHSRLSREFSALATARRTTGWPVFALEHGLSETEVYQLEEAARGSLLGGPPDMSVYLAWAVYAAEFGYRYDGYEYWQSFASETHGWNDNNAARAFFSDAFQRFARLFHGAKPSGVWARQFRIIAWPITHGILPRDLQQQLVELLYDERYSIRPASLDVAEAEVLGKYLHAASERYSERFRQFAANEALLGQIAAALLLQEPGEVGLLRSSTLDRIVADINRERTAADQLHDARMTASRLRVNGLSHGFGSPAPTTRQHSPSEFPREATVGQPPRFESRLLLTPVTDGWKVRLEVPDLTPLVRQRPAINETLRGRGRLLGAAQPIATGLFLFGGAQSFAVAKWPLVDEPLIRYENAGPDALAVLNTLFCIPHSPSWLFRVAPDGRASLVKSGIAHPGETYLWLSRTRIDRPAPGLVNVNLHCDGIYGLQLTVPQTSDQVWDIILERLSIAVTKTMTVSPLGVTPIFWDGAGNAEWLVGDEIMLGVGADHNISGIIVSLDGGDPWTISVAEPRAGPLLLDIGAQSEGDHRLTIQTIPENAGQARIRGTLDFRARYPRRVLPGTSTQEAVLFLVDPPRPSLEDLWANRITMQLSGPTNWKCKVRFSLLDRRGNHALVEKPFDLRLPVDTASWRKRLKQLRDDRSVYAQYDLAHQCRVEFDVGTLGKYTIVAERAFAAMRWVVSANSTRTELRLVDDTDADQTIVTCFDCTRPANGEIVPNGTIGVPVDPPGALFVADDGQHSASIIVAPSRKARSLEELGLHVTISASLLRHQVLPQFVRTAALWEGAHIGGSALAAVYREQVLTEMMLRLFASIGGEAWGQTERLAANEREQLKCGIGTMYEQLTSGQKTSELTTALQSDMSQIIYADPNSRAMRFHELATHTLPFETSRLAANDRAATVAGHDGSGATEQHESSRRCDFALRLASSPHAAVAYAGSRLEADVEDLVGHPYLAQVARFLVLAVHSANAGLVGEGAAIYAGWEWPCAS